MFRFFIRDGLRDLLMAKVNSSNKMKFWIELVFTMRTQPEELGEGVCRGKWWRESQENLENMPLGNPTF